MDTPTISSLPTCNILLVDDGPGSRASLAKLVRLAVPSAQIHPAATYDEAKSALASDTVWHLVVTDVALSKDDVAGLGISILHEARDRGLPAIVVSVTKKIGARGAQAASDRGARYYNKWDLANSDDVKREFINRIRGLVSNGRLPSRAGPSSVFVAYSHEDMALCKALELHLAALERENAINVWSDRHVGPGREWRPELEKRLDDASLILLLVSHNFIASDSCYDEMNRAMQRHESGQARVIPVILSPCEWENTPMARLQALPKGGRPVTSWPNTVDAFADIVKGVRQAI